MRDKKTPFIIIGSDSPFQSSGIRADLTAANIPFRSGVSLVDDCNEEVYIAFPSLSGNPDDLRKTIEIAANYEQDGVLIVDRDYQVRVVIDDEYADVKDYDSSGELIGEWAQATGQASNLAVRIRMGAEYYDIQ